MEPVWVGVIGIIVLLVLIAFRVPIAAAFALVGFLGFWYLGGFFPSLSVLGSVPYGWASHYVLITIPLFILMGQFAYHAGISRALYDTAYRWLGRLPGGLAVATMGACALFAACTGSSVASAATMGTISIPEMKRFNYDKRLAAGTVATGGTLGILIPPSTGFIVYGILTETSIGKLFIAGIFPGLLLALLFSLLIIIRARLNPGLAPPGESFSWRERLIYLKGVGGMLILFILVMGGLYLGIFTPTEAGAIGAFGAMLLAITQRRLNRENLVTSLKEALRTSCMIFAIIIGAMIFNTFLAVSRLPVELGEWLAGLPFPRHLILSFILLMYIPLGCFMDALAMLVLTLPIIFPAVEALGFDPIWFGVLLTILVEIGLITPPVGMNCYVLSGVVKDIPLEDIFRGIIPFIGAFVFGLAILVTFPQISLFLPGMMR